MNKNGVQWLALLRCEIQGIVGAFTVDRGVLLVRPNDNGDLMIVRCQ